MIRLRIIVITGTPGVGKTSVSRLLAIHLRALHLNLAKIVEDEGLTIGMDDERGSLIADLDKLSKRVNEILKKALNDVIVEGHFAADVVPGDVVSHVFILRCDPDELKRRLEERGFRERKVLENVAAEILDVCLWDAISMYGRKKACEIDVTEKSIKEIVDEIMAVLNGSKKASVGIVDWLNKLSMEGRLENFFGS